MQDDTIQNVSMSLNTYCDHFSRLKVNVLSPGLEEGLVTFVRPTHPAHVLHRVCIGGTAQHHHRGGDVGVAESQAGEQ